MSIQPYVIGRRFLTIARVFMAPGLPPITCDGVRSSDPRHSRKGVMKMRHRFITSVCGLFLCFLIGALATPSYAQERGGFGFRVQFGPDVERLVNQAEDHTSQLASMLEERNRDALGDRARDLQSQINMVSSNFNESSSYDRRAQVASVLRVAESLNNAMRYRRVDYDVQRQWSMVRTDLNRLARIYGLRPIY